MTLRTRDRARGTARAVPDSRPRRLMMALALGLGLITLLAAAQAARAASWTLDGSPSFVSFASIKAKDIGEVHSFGALSGSVAEDGTATVTIDLASVNTGIDIRDERLRTELFHIDQFPAATITAPVPLDGLSDLAVGESAERDVTATLDLAGESHDLAVPLLVTRLSETRMMVQPLQLLIVQADDYALGDGIGTLREIAGLSEISHAVPVTFLLVFEHTP
ncbi:YceI family protein [Roseospira marina]|uniref:YceI family protein n=1 Tax=Roseospira marina TaxID=140057 RepID=A0A5M6IB87_9PROT|nr:YceI family protein [Roseospira marina]KAA5605503.1 YceI family protein [Roseospira marina]MBB4314491.1 polyisoprenoid-binding protein YceI [Roseospira marina]MBB5088681.1 polyisoprenoid-binding protein YceI [Roseospira marina]